MSRAPRLTGDERARAIELYRSGLPIAQVAACIGRSTYAVRCALVAAGVPRRPASVAPRTADAERDEVVRLYIGGLSTYQVAARVGRPQGAVRRVLVGAGVALRPPGWPKDASTRHLARP